MSEDATPDDSHTTSHPTGEGAVASVLFLCVHNAGRSQMAAGWTRHLAGDRVQVLSGGSNPADQVNPAAVQAMREVGVDISRQSPQRWTDANLDAADVVITMGCGDTCPLVPGTRYLDWELEDPAGQSVDRVRVVRDEIRRRVVTAPRNGRRDRRVTFAEPQESEVSHRGPRGPAGLSCEILRRVLPPAPARVLDVAGAAYGGGTAAAGRAMRPQPLCGDGHRRVAPDGS